MVDTAKIPGLNNGHLISSKNGEMSKVFSDSNLTKTSRDKGSPLENGNLEQSAQLSSSMQSTNNIMASKSRSGLGKIFTLSKSVRECSN